jgi:ribosomal protein S18 acetylase RimI-like enzyme
MVIRPAIPQDAEAIARLHIASWQATYTMELPQAFLTGQDLAARSAHWRSRIDKGTHVLLAEEDEALVGFVAFGSAHAPDSASNRDWEIHNLHVHPARHNQGIGGVLFQKAASIGRQHGAPVLRLWVVRTNTSARKFYERLGMHLDGTEQEHTVAPGLVFDEVRYALELGDA